MVAQQRLFWEVGGPRRFSQSILLHAENMIGAFREWKLTRGCAGSEINVAQSSVTLSDDDTPSGHNCKIAHKK